MKTNKSHYRIVCSDGWISRKFNHIEEAKNLMLICSLVDRVFKIETGYYIAKWSLKSDKCLSK